MVKQLFEDMVGGVEFSTVTDVSALQPVKACEASELMPEPRVSVLRPEQLPKACEGIDVTVEGKVTVVSALQP